MGGHRSLEIINSGICTILYLNGNTGLGCRHEQNLKSTSLALQTYTQWFSECLPPSTCLKLQLPLLTNTNVIVMELSALYFLL